MRQRRACRKDLLDAAGSLSKGIVWRTMVAAPEDLFVFVKSCAFYEKYRPLSSGGVIRYLPSGFLTVSLKARNTYVEYLSRER